MLPLKTIWTIGHSTRTSDEFIELLQSCNIQLLADIRTFPGSKRYPHFNMEALKKHLTENSVGYMHLKDLGGRRKPSKDSKNDTWRVEGFRGYADYMETGAFVNAVRDLEAIATRKRTACMCTEALWWSCHRALLSDHLKSRGWQVLHILTAKKTEEHRYSQVARIVDGKLSYRQPNLFDPGA